MKNDQMNEIQFKQMILEKIPFAKAMQIEVLKSDLQSVEIKLPLEVHLNHQKTAFGGSLYTAGVLSAWGYLLLLIEKEKLEVKNCVIQRGEIEYLRPVVSDFISSTTPSEKVNHFLLALQKHKRARVTLESVIYNIQGEVSARFKGDFVLERREKSGIM